MSVLYLSTLLCRVLGQKIIPYFKSLLGSRSLWKHPQSRICRLLWLIGKLGWGAKEDCRFWVCATEWRRRSEMVEWDECCLGTLMCAVLRNTRVGPSGGSWIYGPRARERDLSWRWRSGSCQLGDKSEAMGQVRSPKDSVCSENKKAPRIDPGGRSNVRGGQPEQRSQGRRLRRELRSRGKGRAGEW